jgi:thiol-disulfide isomerase/thioredoxin
MSPAAALLIVAALTSGDGPIVYEVPSAGGSLADQRRAAFVAAPFRVERGQIVRGDWRSSDEILGRGSAHVIVAASWCPACKALLSRLGRERTRRVPVLLFLEDEYALHEASARGAGKVIPTRPGSRRPVLWDAAMLEGFPLQLWLLRAGSSIERQLTAYPFHLVCTRDACRPVAAGRGRAG